MNGFRPEPPVLSPKRSPRRARRARRRPLCCPRQFRGRSPAATGRTPSREPAQRSAQRVGLGCSLGFRVFVRFTLLGDVVLGLETLYDLVTFRLPWVSKGFCRMLTSGCRTKTSSACGLSGRSWPCAGLRSVRWNAPNALECAECAGMRWNAPIAPFAPNCAVCADCALFAPNCSDCVGIALEFCLQPGTQPYTHGWRSLVATSLLAACSFRAVPVVPGFCGSLLHQFPQSCDFSSTVSHAERQTMPVKN